MTVKDTPRKRQAPKKELAAPRGIPSSWENADYADKMLVTMKEKGNSWAEIRATWQEVTGQDTAPRYALKDNMVLTTSINLVISTLPNRYNRIKVNMMRMNEADVCYSPRSLSLSLSPFLRPAHLSQTSSQLTNHSTQQHQHLLQAKKEIEDAFATGFWANVATNMERRGAAKYPTAFLQKTFKELEATGKITNTAANTNDNHTGNSDAATTTTATAALTTDSSATTKEEDQDAGDCNAA